MPDQTHQPQTDFVSSHALESAYKQLFHHISDAACIVKDEVFVDANEACLSMFRCKKEDFVGKPIYDFISPEMHEAVKERMVKRKQGEPLSNHADFAGLRADGTIIQIESSAADIDVEGTRLQISIFRDVTVKRFKEAELLASEEFFRRLADAMSIGIVMDTIDTRPLYYNRAMEELTGYTNDELMQRGSPSLISQDNMQMMVEKAHAMLNGKPLDPVEVDLITKSGKKRRVYITGAPLKTNGQVDAIVSIVQDIGALRQTEAALEQSEREFCTLVNALPTGIMTTDSEGRITYVNQEITAITGYSAEELLGTNNMLVHPEDQQALAAVIQKAESGEGIRHHHCRFVRKDGSTGWCSLSIEPRIAETDVIGLYCAFMDITDRKAIEEALRQSEARFRSFIENTTDIITVIDNEGKVRYLSPSAAKISGYPVDELMELSVLDFIHPEDLEISYKAMAELMQNPGAHVNIEVRQKRIDGSWCHLEVAGSSIWDDNGQPLIVLNSRDMTARKQAEEALRESEKKFRNLFQNSNDAIFLLELNKKQIPSRIVEVNNVACTITGYTREELLTMCIFDLDVTESSSGAKKNVNDILAKGQSTFERVIKCKDGKLVPIEVSGSIFNFNGQTVVLSSVRDITERKLAEEEIRKSEELLSNVVESIHIGVWVGDRDFNIKLWNLGQEVMTGVSRDEVLGLNIFDRFPSLGEAGLEVLYRRVVETCEPLVLDEFPFIDPTLKKVGYYLNIKANALTDADGKVTGIVVAVEDVTEHIKAEEALRESETKFKSYIDQSIDGVFVVDKNGRYIEVNPAGCALMGYSREELLQMNIRDLVSPDQDNVEKALVHFETLVKTGKSRGEVSHRRKDGSDVITEIHAVALDKKRYMGVVRDVTERKHAEQTVLKSLKAIEKAYALQSEFVRNMTHEVRTPLTGVIGYAQALLEGVTGNVSEEQRKVLKRIVEQAESLLKIVEEVLESATLAAGVQKLDLRTLRLENVLHDVVNIFEKTAREKGISISYRCSSRLPVIVSDAQKLTRIISNLLSNSVKFTFSGGVMISAAKSGAGIDIVIEDSGTGIPKDRQEQIFDAFVQLSYPGKHKPVGAGLGLSIVSELVDVLGCSLTLSSLSGTGTAFTLHVPLQHKEMR